MEIIKKRAEVERQRPYRSARKPLYALGAFLGSLVLVLAVASPVNAAMQWYKNSQAGQASIASSPTYAWGAGGRVRTSGSLGGLASTYADHYAGGSRIGGTVGGTGIWLDFIHTKTANVRAYCYWNSSWTITGTTLLSCGVKQDQGDTGFPPQVTGSGAQTSESGLAAAGAPSVDSFAVSDPGAEPSASTRPGSDGRLAVVESTVYSERVTENGFYCVKISEASVAAEACTTPEDYQQRGIAVGLLLPSNEVRTAYVLPEAVRAGAQRVVPSASERIVVGKTARGDSVPDESVRVVGASGKEFVFPGLNGGWLNPLSGKAVV
jgi:hypothetical protein